MPSLMNVRRCIQTSRIVQCSHETVLKVLHDPHTLATLSPIVISATVDPSDPATYIITDKLTILGCFDTHISYKAKFSFGDHGADVVVSAGAGTTLKTTWKAQKVEEGTEITEDASIEVCILPRSFEKDILLNATLTRDFSS